MTTVDEEINIGGDDENHKYKIVPYYEYKNDNHHELIQKLGGGLMKYKFNNDILKLTGGNITYYKFNQDGGGGNPLLLLAARYAIRNPSMAMGIADSFKSKFGEFQRNQNNNDDDNDNDEDIRGGASGDQTEDTQTEGDEDTQTKDDEDTQTDEGEEKSEQESQKSTVPKKTPLDILAEDIMAIKNTVLEMQVKQATNPQPQPVTNTVFCGPATVPSSIISQGHTNDEKEKKEKEKKEKEEIEKREREERENKERDEREKREREKKQKELEEKRTSESEGDGEGVSKGESEGEIVSEGDSNSENASEGESESESATESSKKKKINVNVTNEPRELTNLN